jgi:hypothetical protein
MIMSTRRSRAGIGRCPSNHRFVLRVLTLLAMSAPAAAQDRVPARALGPREAVATETFSQVRGFRELSDGRLIISDQRERKIMLLDLVKRTATPVGRPGPGPAEHQLATDLLPTASDTTLLIDVGRGTENLSIITPDGRIDGSVRLPDGARSTYLWGADRDGVLYFSVRTIRTDPSEPAPDSASVLQVDLKRNQAAIGFRFRATPRDPRAPNPYNPGVQWTIAPDGRVAIVDFEPYQVTWIAPDGRGTVGPEIPYERVPVTRRDRDEFRDLARRISGLGQGGVSTTGGRAAAPPEPTFPSHKPVFFGNDAAMVAPNGELWVRRAQPAGEDAPVHEIIDGAGRRIATITLPPNTRLLDLGRHGVYLARYDDDDLIHIERYRYP